MGGGSARSSQLIAAVVAQALGTAAVCLPPALAPRAAWAQGPESPQLTTQIPAQPVSRALAALASQTGLQFVYVSGVIRNQRSQPVVAGLSARDALLQMLQGTGLRFRYLTAHSVRILPAPVAEPAPDSARDGLGEVIVTATRRRENLQDVPTTVQVLTQDTLAKLNATTFDDFLSFLPGVTAHGVGPGQNNIYVRGLGTAANAVQGSGFGGTFPTVAVYVDEQSVQLPGRNLDLYAADLERIEVLEGPQGTLFGSGAEAGVLRYITNKPKLDVTEATVNGGYAITAHGAPSTALDAVLNVPLIPQHLAARVLIYNEKRGGYIDNVPATFAHSSADLSIQYAYSNNKVPAENAVINNGPYVGANINPVTYQGVRAEVLYQVNDDWQALLTQSYQLVDAQGVFTEMQTGLAGEPLPPLSVELFNPSYNKDRFESTALTVSGQVGPLEVLYAGTYLVRNIEQVQDYTSYARGGLYADYYQCVQKVPGSNNPATSQCFSPSSSWHLAQRNTHQTHELRFTTPAEWRLRAVGGLFYENYLIQSNVDWFYLTALPYFYPVAPPNGYWVNATGQVACGCQGTQFISAPVTLINPNVRPLGDAFFNDITRGYRQRAAYFSADFDIVPQRLTLSAGTRYFDDNISERGATATSFGCQRIYGSDPPDPCIDRDFIDLDALHLAKTYTGFRSRAGLSWKVTDDALLYYTWSQGFRSGGFNRGFGNNGSSPLTAVQPPNPVPPWQAIATKNGGWTAPYAYAPDTLINNEIGWKTTWLSERLQWNGDLYQERWNNAQIDGTDSAVLSGSVLNGGDYRVRGLESSLTAHVSEGWTLEAALAWSHSALVKEAQFYWANGQPVDFSLLHLQGQTVPLPNPLGTLGSPLAGAPPFQGNVRVRYELPWHEYRAFAQIAATYQSHSLATTDQITTDFQGQSTYYELPGFASYDAALGASRDGWTVQLYGQNLSDKQAQLFANYQTYYYKAITVSRPRTLGLRFSYKFSGS